MAKSLAFSATSDDTKDVTGFALKELADLTLSSPSISSELSDIFLRRLAKDSADVKYKSLKCIRYLCLHGRSEFRLQVARDTSEIKNCLGWRGHPDPLRGDATNQRVRDEAKEAINAVFNGPSQAHANQNRNNSQSGRMEGYGGGAGAGPAGGEQSSAAAQHFAAPSSQQQHNPNASNPSNNNNNKAMVGFGNPQYDNSKGRSSPTFLEKMKSKMNDVNGGGTVSGAGRNANASAFDSSRPSGSGSSGAGASVFIPPPVATFDANAAGRKRGEVGGMWASGGADDPPAAVSRANSSSISNQFAPAANPNNVPHNAAHAVVRPTSSNGEYESRLLDSLTPASGVRLAPSKDELAKFASQCASLDKLLLVRILCSRQLAADAHPTTQTKALFLLESILTSGAAGGGSGGSKETEEAEDFLCENADNLVRIETSGSTALLRAKVVRVMELCGLREAARPTASVTPATAAAATASGSSFYASPAPAPQPREVDLFGFMSSPPPTAAVAPAPVAAVASSSAFGFLGDSSSDSASPSGGNNNSNSNDMFGSMDLKPAAPAPASQAPKQDVFDLFAPSSSSSPSNASAQSAQKQPSSSASSSTSSSTSASDSLDFLNPSVLLSSTTKVDPLTLLMSTTRIAHPQPRPAQHSQNNPHNPGPFGANGMAGFAPRTNGMPQLGPTQYQAQGQGQGQGQFQGQGQRQGMYANGNGQFGGLQQPSSSMGNNNIMFQVPSASSSSSFPSSSSSSSTRRGIDLDSFGAPINPSSSSHHSSSSSVSGSSAFGFVTSTGGGGAIDSFGFVNDMMKK